jgi:chaperonin cofactor prefoldin
MTFSKTPILPNNTHSILIEKLILVGIRKNYVIPFFRGVNVVYGDSTTGKSSILELINYLLGSSTFIYDEEIESSVSYAILEVNLGSTLFTIKRDIFDNSKFIEVYKSSYQNIDEVFPKKYSPNYSTIAPDGFYLDFIMTSLDLPSIRIRQAPTQPDSNMVRLSFRDIFKYCYLDQDNVGSKQILDLANPSVFVKNKQTFKYFFDLLDTNISDLEQEISTLNSQKNKLTQKYESVSEFLREIEFESTFTIDDSAEDLDLQAQSLTLELDEIRRNIHADAEEYRNLKEILNEITQQLNFAEHSKISSEAAIERYSRLKNDYLNDIEKIKALKTAKSLIGVSDVKEGLCPLCDSSIVIDSIKEEFNISDSDNVNHEVLALKRRVKDLLVMIESEKNTHRKALMEIKGFGDEQQKARRMLDEESSSMISPYISQRDGILMELTSINEKKLHLAKSLKVRNQQRAIFDQIEKDGTSIEALSKKLEILRESAPSLDGIISELSDLLIEYLKFVGIKDQRNISISKKSYLPVLRDRDYAKITSGGLRTILSIGHYANLHKASLFLDMNLPRFLMIDTVGKYLAKTQDRYLETDSNEDKLENVSDPEKYKNVYDYLFKITEIAEQKGLISQIILVDNDVPEYVRETYAGFIVAHYSSNGNSDSKIGLIDDAPKYS